jgi:hypothetical protein
LKKISDEQGFGKIFRLTGAVESMPEPAAEGKFSLEQLQEAVGGYIEVVPGHLGEAEGLLMLADEEGLMKGLPINQMASMMAGRVLVGTVVVIPSGRMD